MDQPTLTKLLKAEGIAMSATELHKLTQGAAAAPTGLNQVDEFGYTRSNFASQKQCYETLCKV